MGIFLGASVLTLSELMEVMVMSIVVLLQKMFRPTSLAPMPVSPAKNNQQMRLGRYPKIHDLFTVTLSRTNVLALSTSSFGHCNLLQSYYHSIPLPSKTWFSILIHMLVCKLYILYVKLNCFRIVISCTYNEIISIKYDLNYHDILLSVVIY